MTPKPKPVAVPEPAKWYDFMERLVPYCDVILLIGAVIVTVGIAVIYWPAALIAAGAGLIYLAWKMGQS